VPDCHFHLYSSLNLTQLNHSNSIYFMPLDKSMQRMKKRRRGRCLITTFILTRLEILCNYQFIKFNLFYFIPLDEFIGKEGEKKKVKVPDYHFHSDSSRNLPQFIQLVQPI